MLGRVSICPVAFSSNHLLNTDSCFKIVSLKRDILTTDVSTSDAPVFDEVNLNVVDPEGLKLTFVETRK